MLNPSPATVIPQKRLEPAMMLRKDCETKPHHPILEIDDSLSF